MAVLKVLRARPELFFRLSGIRPVDFDAPVCQLHPIWLAGETGRLSRKNRQRAIGGGRKYRLQPAEQMLLCLIYCRTYAGQAFVGLLFDISSPTVCRRVRAMTTVMAGHFAMPERRIKFSTQERNDLLYLMGALTTLQFIHTSRSLCILAKPARDRRMVRRPALKREHRDRRAFRTPFFRRVARQGVLLLPRLKRPST